MMTPEDYQRAGVLFEQLRDLPHDERAATLDEICGGNAELRVHVLRLLVADDRAARNSFLERRAIDDAADLLASAAPRLPAAGTVFGNYCLGNRIETGGMGVVYEGRDLRLQRRVAIKILPLPFAEEGAEQIKRFKREARAASLLNHPNIVSIFDADFAQGHYYIATEFIEGRTLRQLMAAESAKLDVRTVLDLVAQIASALSAAHEAGIVHRDIKPENIMVRPDGFVKVLDFGLAKLREPASSLADGASEFRTRPGRLAGTIQYLSPEQVAGKPVDARSDLFSVGVVAYELATGVRPFDGPTDGAVYDAILHRTPPSPSSVRPKVDSGLEGLIMRALEKDPELRFQTASDLRSSCRRLSGSTMHSGALPAAATPRVRRVGWKLAAAVCASVGATALWYFALRPIDRSWPTVPVQFLRLTDAPGEENFPSLSPDGQQLLYASAREGNWDVYLQRTGGSTAINLTRDSQDDDVQPTLSPDGSQIAFRSERDGGGLFVMESTGENPRRITRDGYLPAWAPDGRHVVYSSDTFTTPSVRGAPVSRLFVVDIAAGSERKLETDDAIQPNWSPHGDRIAYWGIVAGGRRGIFTVAASGKGRASSVTEDAAIDWSPVWSSKGDQLYFLSDRGGSMNIWRVPVDERSGRALGPLEPVTVPAPYVGGLALARDGKALVYSQASQRTTLHWIGYDPVHRSVVGTPQAVDTEHTVANFSFSPDGSKIVFDTIGDTPEELWIMNADGSGRRRLTSDGHRNRTPAWSPDAKEIVFFSDRSGQYDTWLIQPNGSGLRPLTTGTHPAMQRAIWSPDGTRILASRSPGPSVMLDPKAAAPVSSPRPAEGIQGMVYWNAWTAGGDGSLAIGDLVASDNPSASSIVGSGEIVVYSPAEAHAERTGVTGRRAFWLPASNRSDPPHRSFIFARVGECWLYDRALRREVRLFSVAPNRLYYLGGVGPDQHRIYFSQTVRDADLWLARLEK